MHIVWAGLGAVIVGAGDFAGGAATRRDQPLRVTTLAFAFGAVFLLAFVPLFGGAPTSADLWWGALSGVGGAFGVFALYRGFQRAAMGLVAPVAAVITVTVPVVGGVVAGERPSLLVWTGLLVAFAAIVLISMGPAVSTTGSRWSAVGHGLATGVGFGGLLLAITQIGAEAGLMPIVAGRFVSFVLSLGLAFIVGAGLVPSSRPAFLITLVSGVLTGSGNALYYLALTEGPIVSSTVIYSMFPASTVVLAWLIYDERLRIAQMAGVVLALVATGLLVAG